MNRLIYLLLAAVTVSCSGISQPVPPGKAPLADLGPIREFLDQQAGELHLPARVRGLYAENGYRFMWTNRQQQFRDAVMTLDCVIQFGLTPDRYHPAELTAVQTRLLEPAAGGRDSAALARTDVLLTDAVLTLMSDLHYGRYNPRVSLEDVDDPRHTAFSPDSVLRAALASPGFRETILEVQPQVRGYRLLQDYQRLLSSQYTGDRYDISDDTLRLISVNLERYRWQHAVTHHYAEINIPSYRLEYVNGTIRERFRVIVGKPSSPTPALSGRIEYFTTAPDWKVPAGIFRKEILPAAIADAGYLERNHFTIYDRRGEPVPTDPESLRSVRLHPERYTARQSGGCDNALGRVVFYFENPYSVYLHDTPGRHLFGRKYRALSHGCIRVERPERLVELLLDAEAAPKATRLKVASSMESYTTYRYHLKMPVPIVIRYITCEVEQGLLVRHPDVYGRDQVLSRQLFGKPLPPKS